MRFTLAPLTARTGWTIAVGSVLVTALVGAAAAAEKEERSGHTLLSTPYKDLSEQSRDVCMFCHFPLGEDPDWPGWKRNGILATQHFQTFATTGITVPSDEPTGAVGSVSLACLSCHDGVSAPNVSIVHQDQLNHPVGVPYAGGAFTWDPALEELGIQTEKEYDGEMSDYPMPEIDLINRNAVWWVETGKLGRQKSDLQLYSRSDPETGEETPYVECSTCHDPHSKELLFLRAQNDYSRLCTTCHRQ